MGSSNRRAAERADLPAVEVSHELAQLEREAEETELRGLILAALGRLLVDPAPRAGDDFARARRAI
jgi:hypothetical protein